MASEKENPIYKRIEEAVHFLQEKSKIRPQFAMILGSGLGPVAEILDSPEEIPYQDIPHFQTTAVIGHAGKLLLGQFQGQSVAILMGRYHFYEGHSMEQVTFPTRVLHGFGVKTLLLTNAAGAINTRFRPGDLMMIEDHLNLTGNNPLIGPNLSQLGPRFPDMTEAYSFRCRKLIEESAKKTDVSIQKGIYGGLLGPTFETPAEVRMLRTLGADAVGMSTVAETIVAKHAGMEVCGISCITNLAAGMSSIAPNHEEVLEVSQIGSKKLRKILQQMIPALNKK